MCDQQEIKSKQQQQKNYVARSNADDTHTHKMRTNRQEASITKTRFVTVKRTLMITFQSTFAFLVGLSWEPYSGSLHLLS